MNTHYKIFGAILVAMPLVTGCGSMDVFAACSSQGGWTDSSGRYDVYDTGKCEDAKYERDIRKRAISEAETGSGYDKYKVGRAYEVGGSVQTATASGLTQFASVNADRSKAIKWYKMAAGSGDSGEAAARQALVRLGYSEYRSAAQRSLETAAAAYARQDYSTAAEHWKFAAENGEVTAYNDLAVLYFNGKGVPQNDAEAFRWFHKLAKTGESRGEYAVAWMYHYNRAVAPSGDNDVEAVSWYRQAAEDGLADAQYSLGLMYEAGRGIDRSYEVAAVWFRRAAAQNYAAAQYSMGNQFENGLGVTKDASQALEWYRKAGAQGDQGATEAIARLSRSQ